MSTISSSSETIAKRGTIFLTIRKTVNIQGYSKLREPIRTPEKLLSTDLVNAKTTYLKGFFQEKLWCHFIEEVKQNINLVSKLLIRVKLPSLRDDEVDVWRVSPS